MLLLHIWCCWRLSLKHNANFVALDNILKQWTSVDGLSETHKSVSNWRHLGCKVGIFPVLGPSIFWHESALGMDFSLLFHPCLCIPGLDKWKCLSKAVLPPTSFEVVTASSNVRIQPLRAWNRSAAAVGMTLCIWGGGEGINRNPVVAESVSKSTS